MSDVGINGQETPDGSGLQNGRLGSRAIKGMGWRSGSVVIQAVGQVLYTAIMSRLVSPEAFGLVAMTVVARGVGTLLSRMGIGQALIQKPNLTEKDIRAGVALSTLFGVLFFGLFWFLAPLFARLFSEPDATSVIRAASSVFIILGLQSTPNNILRRELRFKESAIIHSSNFLIAYFLIGVGLAIAGGGVWALIAAPISHSLLDGVLMYWRVRHPVRPTLHWDAYKGLLKYGTKISFIQLADFFGSQTDTIVVGRYAGTDLLGIYNRAFYLAVLPLQMIMGTMHYVLFASFSKIQGDVPRLARAYLSSARVSAALFFPAAAAIAVSSQELIAVLLGNRYSIASAVVPYFSLFAAMNMMSSLCGVLCEALAELNKRMALQVTYLAGLATALWLAAGSDLWVYGAVLGVGEVIRNLAYNVLIVRRIIPVEGPELLHMYPPALTAAGLVVGAVLGTRAVVVTILDLPVFLALLAEGGAALAAFMFMVRRGTLRFLRSEIESRLRSTDPTQGNPLLSLMLRVMFGPQKGSKVA